MNLFKTSMMSLAMALVATGSLSAELCQQSGCDKDAQESVKYCVSHGCSKGRSAEKLCSLQTGHSDVCKMVKRGEK